MNEMEMEIDKKLEEKASEPVITNDKIIDQGKKVKFKVPIDFLDHTEYIEFETTKAGLKRAKLNGVILGRSTIPQDIINAVENYLKQKKSYNEIHRTVKYRTKNGSLRHISIGKISEIKKQLSKKEGAISG